MWTLDISIIIWTLDKARYLGGGRDISGPWDIPVRTCFTVLKACPFTWNQDNLGGEGTRYLAWTTRVTWLTGTTIIHVNALHRDISGGRDNFDCNAHDQYSHMEANTHNMQEEIHLIDMEQQQKEKYIEKTDITKVLLNAIL